MVVSLQKTPDQLHWEALLNGNRDALAGLYEKYFDLLYEYGMRLCHDPELVKDCIQDLFIKLWTNRNNLSITTSIKPYLYTSLRNTVINKLEQEKHIRERENKTIHDFPFNLHYNIESSMIQNEEDLDRNSLVINALEQLTSRQKECIYLRFYSGLEYTEIADIMNISLKAAYKIAGRAIGFLRKYLKEIDLYLPILLSFICNIF